MKKDCPFEFVEETYKLYGQPLIKFQQNILGEGWGGCIINAKENMWENSVFGIICFTSVAIIGGKL